MLNIFPALRELWVRELGWWSKDKWRDLLAARGLRKLTLHSCYNLPGERLADLARLPELEELHFDHCLGFDDDDFAGLAGITTLRRLTLRYCDKYSVKSTFKGLLRLSGLPLESLDIGGACHFRGWSGKRWRDVCRAFPGTAIE